MEFSHKCVCGKQYNQHSSLWRHHKTCNVYINTIDDSFNEDIQVSKDNIHKLVQENIILKEQCNTLQEQNNKIVQENKLLQDKLLSLYEQHQKLLQNQVKYLQEQLHKQPIVASQPEIPQVEPEQNNTEVNQQNNFKYVNTPIAIRNPVIRNHKTKEKYVVNIIQQTFANYTWIADKRVGCSRRRPDLLLDMGSHIIIVEIDEYKHANYDCSCENTRVMEISKDLQHRPIVFIRFNPDDYIDSSGNRVKSCWKLNERGIMQIDKMKEQEWEHRIDVLIRQIEYWINNTTDKTVETIELFY